MSEKAKSILFDIVEWVISVVIALGIALLLREYVFTLVEVKGESMQHSLEDQDRLFVYRWGYSPELGDIIVFDPPNDNSYYVKRVIATEGQTVDIDYDKDVVYVDGVPLYEPYIKDPDMTEPHYSGLLEFPITVPENYVFCLGDNRNNSMDSRFESVGCIEKKAILGKANFRLFPFDAWGSLY